MGAWGHGIREDDLVRDVISSFDARLQAGVSIADATQAVLAEYASAIGDADEGPLVWIALADAQWSYGELDPNVQQRVQADLAAGLGLERWSENPRTLARRQAALTAFLTKIAAPNPRPRRLRKATIRPPKFRAGDCLCVQMADGQYAAALVMATDHSDPENGKDLLVTLDYLAHEPPPIALFAERRWLRLTHHSWRARLDLAWYLAPGFRAVRDRITVVGQTEILTSDPKESESYSSWRGVCEQIVHQRAWDAAQS